MERTHVDDVPAAALSGGSGRYDLGRTLGTTDVALMHYDLDPGEPFSVGYHAHESQEEVFYIVEGTAAFDTESGTVTVEAGEALRFAPGEFQQGYVPPERDTGVTALALGAPPGMDDTIVVFHCDECGEETDHDTDLDEEAGWEHLVCRECGNRLVVLPKEGEESDLM